MGFTGTIPPQLGNLSFLISLDLSYNNFQGELPPEFTRLEKLRAVDLSFNFTREIPKFLGDLQDLQIFTIENNSFSWFIPYSISNMKNLGFLNLRNMTNENQTNGSVAGTVAAVTSRSTPAHAMAPAEKPGKFSGIDFKRWQMKMLFYLTTLSLQRFIKEDPPVMADNTPDDERLVPRTLQSFKWLRIGFNKLNGANVLSIFNISTLEYLDLRNAGLTDDLPSDLCRRLPRLQRLGLNFNMLSGEIPRSISECSKLQVLLLLQNNFIGAIPRQLGKLHLLQILALGFNKLQGTIPDEIGHLYNLKQLGMERNKLTGSIPLTIFNISSLQILSMWDNKLEGPLPREVGNLTMLNVLDLGVNNLTGVLPDEIGNLQQLLQLKLDFNTFSGSIHVSIFNMSSLVSISLIQNHISGNLPSAIGHRLSNLERIFLGANNINGFLPSSISNLSKLIILELSANELTGSVPDSLGNLRLIEILNLQGNSFTSESSPLSFITPLANCKHLRELILSLNPLNAMLPKSIGNLSSLQIFEADGCNLRGHVPIEIRNLRNLPYLKLEDNDLTGIVPRTISSLKKLQQFSLGANRISGPSPNSLCELSNLGLLNLSQNQIQGSIPSCLRNVTSLREVYLYSNNFTAGIPSSLWNLKDILKMNLSSNFFNGSLPLEVGNLKAAILLDLSWNQISGNIPKTIGRLQKLSQLSFAHNRIEGSIPETFGELINLEALDLSYNNITGVIPKSLEALKQLDSFNVSFNKLHREIPNGGPFVDLPYQSFVSNEGLCGSGSFGSLYKGALTDGMIVAVKVFNVQMEGTFQTFDKEHEILWNLRHKNLTKILAAVQILNIMADVASALEYLHHGYSVPVVHCDLKPSNVLLDKDMVGHLTDFGIAKLLTKEESIAQTTTFATIGYIAPEYGLEGLISKRSDAYSYDGDLLTLDEENISDKLQCGASVMELAMNCIAKSPGERMNMTDVVATLKKIKDRLSSHYGTT
ncbi:LRR receptor-like serine/threonine-protein kinase FLS2 [Nicotiana sylvestris]|uniref:LRR receptor-like serine/threonine-protein kinase FLS2 n=1 Tax=Nicotiana sylvestris TaxID=4096 RepID=UPI00388CD2BD